MSTSEQNHCISVGCTIVKHADVANNGGNYCCNACKLIPGNHGPFCASKQTVVVPAPVVSVPVASVPVPVVPVPVAVPVPVVPVVPVAVVPVPAVSVPVAKTVIKAEIKALQAAMQAARDKKQKDLQATKNSKKSKKEQLEAQKAINIAYDNLTNDHEKQLSQLSKALHADV